MSPEVDRSDGARDAHPVGDWITSQPGPRSRVRDEVPDSGVASVRFFPRSSQRLVIRESAAGRKSRSASRPHAVVHCPGVKPGTFVLPAVLDDRARHDLREVYGALMSRRGP